MNDETRRWADLLRHTLNMAEAYGCLAGRCAVTEEGNECPAANNIEVAAEGLLQSLSLERARNTVDPVTWDEWETR